MKMMTDRVYSQCGDDYLLEAQKVSGENKPKPHCPYCGHKMVHQYVYGDHFFCCPKCRAVAPDKDTKAEAYPAAPYAARNCASAMPLRRTRLRITSRSGTITANAACGSR
nr:MAG TPA: alpha-aminoadipate carrier protein [Caudoviricetes sp.]